MNVIIVLIGLVISAIVIGLPILAICKYLKTCEVLSYSPLNFNIVLAFLPMILIMWGIMAITNNYEITQGGNAVFLFYYIGFAMFALAGACIIFNIRNCYKRTGSILLSLTNFIIQFIMGLVIACTVGLAIFVFMALTRKLVNDSGDDYDM